MVPHRLAILLLAVSCAAQAHAQPETPPDAAAAVLPSGDSLSTRSALSAWSPPPASAAPAAVEPAVPLWPVSSRFVQTTSHFGQRADPVDAGLRFHAGIDLAGPLGTPVSAAADGVVRVAGAVGGYGEMVAIDHGGGLETRYAHLSHVFVRAGASVGRGDVIGLMGTTGRSTGSHLHFEVRDHGVAMDPTRWRGAGLDLPARAIEFAPSVAPRWPGWRTAPERLPGAF